jgi:hypothetical protein
MFRNIFLIVILCISNIISNNIYLSKITNNIDAKITIEYFVPVYTQVVIKNEAYDFQKFGGGSSNFGFGYRNKKYGFNLDLYSKKYIELKNAYIPECLSLLDENNILAIKVGHQASHFEDKYIYFLRVNDGHLQLKNVKENRWMNCFEEKYLGNINIDISQKHNGLYYLNKTKLYLNIDAFNIKISKS